MKKLRLTLLWSCCLLLLFSEKAMADHVLGEDMAIIPIKKANANFLLVLNLYVDEIRRPVTGREQEQVVQIYRKRDGKYMTQAVVRAYTTPFYRLTFTNDKCANDLNLKQYRMRYEREVMLNPDLYDDPQGYFMLHDRCCRSQEISSLNNPAKSALTIRLEFPPLKQNPEYASTEFDFPNGEFLCVNKPFQMNFTVRNPEQKELRFSFVEPLGGYTVDGAPNNNNPTAIFKTPPPLNWKPGFGISNFIPASKPLSVDAKTGVITVTPTAPGTYTFALMVEEFKNGVRTGMSIRDFSFIVVDCATQVPPVPVITNNNVPVKEIEICAGAVVNLETQNDPDLNYTWQKNGQNILNEELSKISVKDTGTYVVVTSLRSKCSQESTSQKLKIRLSSGSTQLRILTNSTEACEGERITLKTDDPAVKPEWFLDNVFLESNREILANKSGEYVARKGGGPSGCPVVEDKISLLFSAKPIVDVPTPLYEFCPGQVLSIGAFNDNTYRYQWFKDGNILDGIEFTRFKLDVKEKGEYKVLVELVGIQCSVMSEPYKVIYDPDCDPQSPLYFPTSFSPNNDGINDTWEVVNFDKCPDCLILIYDTWGNKIFENNIPWDGRYNGKPVQQGQYNYVIKSSERRYQGAVVVLR